MRSSIRWNWIVFYVGLCYLCCYSLPSCITLVQWDIQRLFVLSPSPQTTGRSLLRSGEAFKSNRVRADELYSQSLYHRWEVWSSSHHALLVVPRTWLVYALILLFMRISRLIHRRILCSWRERCTNKWNELFRPRLLSPFLWWNSSCFFEWTSLLQIPLDCRRTKLMANMDTQPIMKRSIKPKTQYSPSEPTVTALYHLVKYDDTRTIVIVANSSVKKRMNNGALMLNDGRTAKLIMSGESLIINELIITGCLYNCRFAII